jgi:hypothetical protein
VLQRTLHTGVCGFHSDGASRFSDAFSDSIAARSLHQGASDRSGCSCDGIASSNSNSDPNAFHVSNSIEATMINPTLPQINAGMVKGRAALAAASSFGNSMVDDDELRTFVTAILTGALNVPAPAPPKPAA